MDRTTPTCADVDDSPPLPPVLPPQGSGTEKKSRGTAATTQDASDPAGYP
jgi:hypothetical protein